MTMPNQFGQDSVLKIKTKIRNGITVLEDVFFTAPYKIAKPFYDEGNKIMNIMVMSASAGIMEGDCYRVDVELGAGSRVALNGQSYNKIHRMKTGNASQYNKFILHENSLFDYVQKPSIPFAESSFHSRSEFHMKSGSVLLYSDVLACGREKRGECFQFKTYKNYSRVYYNDELIFLDNQLLQPSAKPLGSMGFFEGYTHQATLAYFSEGISDRLIDKTVALMENESGIEFGVSRMKKYGMLVRILGNSSDQLEKQLLKLRTGVYISDTIPGIYESSI